MKRFCLALVLCAFATTIVDAQQPANSGDDKNAFASVDGITTGTGGQPLRKTRVVLNPVPAPPGFLVGQVGTALQPATIAVTSDTEGKFHFEKVPPGVYMLSGEHPGYLQSNYGAKRPRTPGTLLTLTAGKALTGVTLEMHPAAVISGKVLDEDGDPVPQALVRLFQTMYRNGRKQLMPANMRSADSNGEFRFENATPGQFLLAASKRSGYPGEAQVRNGSVKPGEQEQDYVTTYYPGAVEQSAAQFITVVGGQDLSGTNITLKKLPVFHVRGKVTGTLPGKPLSSLRVLASEADSNAIFMFGGVGSSNLAKDGTFDLGAFPSGDYSVSVTNMTGMMQTFARQKIQVGNQDLNDVNLSLQPLGEITGSVQIEGNETDESSRARAQGQNASPIPQMRIALTSMDAIPFGMQPQTVKDDGTFSFSEVPAGRFRLIVIGTPPGSYVSAIRAGGQDAQTDGFEINSGQVKLDVRISRNGGQITGSVTDGQNPAPGAIITLVPEPANPEQIWLYRQQSADQSGNFTLTGVAPGKYRLYAWEDLEPGAYQDPDLTKAWLGKSAEITVKEKSQESAALVRISKAEMESR